MRITERDARLCVLIVTALILPHAVLLRAQNYVRDSEPALLSYDELVQLSSRQNLSPELAEKLRLITTTPFVNNEAYLDGARPRSLEVAGLGPSLRTAYGPETQTSSLRSSPPVRNVVPCLYSTR